MRLAHHNVFALKIKNLASAQAAMEANQNGQAKVDAADQEEVHGQRFDHFNTHRNRTERRFKTVPYF